MSDYVLNSASLAELYSEEATARVQLAALLRGLALLDSNSAVLPSLRLNVDPWLQPLVQQSSAIPLTFGELAHSFYGTADHDLAAFFDSLNRSVPADHALDDVCIEAILRLVPDRPAPNYEQTFDSVLAAGTDGIICAAMNFLLIGLLRSDLWKFDGMGFVSGSETYLFDHVAEPSHAEAVWRRRIAALRAALTARSFWPLRDQVFPRLLFGLDVQRQAERFSTVLVPLMFNRLAELDSRVKTWRENTTSDRFPDGSTAITGETPQTMKRYGNHRNFRGHNGVTKTFEDHMWIDKSHRIHMIRDVATKSVEIGYIGPHLPTMSDPT
jgi:hypothetical protein